MGAFTITIHPHTGYTESKNRRTETADTPSFSDAGQQRTGVAEGKLVSPGGTTERLVKIQDKWECSHCSKQYKATNRKATSISPNIYATSIPKQPMTSAESL
jgi:hypothetical protein